MLDHDAILPGLELIPDDVASNANAAIVVGPDTTLNIEGGRTYSLDSLTVHSGGTVRVNFLPNRTNKWTCIRVSGDVVLLGVLNCLNAPSASDLSTSTVVRSIAPDGTELIHTYAYKRGARGGRGGGWAFGPGGTGGEGDWQCGGGGGGGTTHNGERRPALRWKAGMAANGSVGGTALYDYRQWGGKGGDGAFPQYSADGGLLYLRVEGKLYGAGGTIDVRGAPGVAGQAGQSGAGGGGGGGGGGPGYPGGALYLACSSIESSPHIPLNEASGGGAGLGARSLNTFPGNNGQENGLNGGGGENGNAPVFKLILPPW